MHFLLSLSFASIPLSFWGITSSHTHAWCNTSFTSSPLFTSFRLHLSQRRINSAVDRRPFLWSNYLLFTNSVSSFNLFPGINISLLQPPRYLVAVHTTMQPHRVGNTHILLQHWARVHISNVDNVWRKYQKKMQSDRMKLLVRATKHQSLLKMHAIGFKIREWNIRKNNKPNRVIEQLQVNYSC